MPAEAPQADSEDLVITDAAAQVLVCVQLLQPYVLIQLECMLRCSGCIPAHHRDVQTSIFWPLQATKAWCFLASCTWCVLTAV